jgi:hypothetical protein
MTCRVFLTRSAAGFSHLGLKTVFAALWTAALISLAVTRRPTPITFSASKFSISRGSQNL